MSIVRVGMSENKGYAEGYEAIFGKKSSGVSGKSAPKKSPVAKKTGKKSKKK